MTSLAAIIVNYRTAELTESAARSLLTEEVAQIVIVDNGSGDGSVEYLRRSFECDPRVAIRALRENRGFGAGVNCAAGLANTDLFFVMNSDARLTSASLHPLVERFRDPEVGIVAPLVIEASTREPQADAFGPFPTVRSTLLRRNWHQTADVDWVSGVAFMIRRTAYEAVGGFDEEYFMYFEDVDLCYRVRAQRYQVEREPSVEVEHIGRASSAGSARTKNRQYYTSQDRWLRKSGASRASRSVFGLARLPVRVRRTLLRDRSEACSTARHRPIE